MVTVASIMVPTTGCYNWLWRNNESYYDDDEDDDDDDWEEEDAC